MICTKCKKDKELPEFSLCRRTKKGVKSWCKDCTAVSEANRNHTPEARAKKRLYDANRRSQPGYKETASIQNADWFSRSKDKVYARNNRKKREDPAFKLAGCLRTRLYLAVRNEYKRGSAVQDLGCSIENFKEHLESKFTLGMTWSNYGKGRGFWNIDHIVPLDAFDLSDRQHVVLACHYLNLQPLWFEDNLRKSNKINTPHEEPSE